MIRITGAILTILFCGCFSQKNMSSDFIKKYGGENFAEFNNTSIFVRSSINDSDEIIFAYDDKLDPKLNNGAYVITLNRVQKKIKNASCHLMKDSTIVNKEKLEKLALKFIEYQIGYLSVDSSSNVLINIRANKSPNLIRFSDMKYKTEKYKDWKLIKDNWYEKIME